MGGGDLNLKKSWTVHSLKNQSRVWDAEQSELAERRKIEQVRRERQEEAEIEEIARLAEESGVQKRQQRVEWMYSGAAAVGTGTGTSEEQEAFLLGKRRVTLKKKPEEASVERTALIEQDPIKDIASKVALDPLLMIQKQEHDAMEKAAALQAKADESKRRRDRESRRRYHSDKQLSSRYRDERSPSPRRSRPEKYYSSRSRDDRSRSPHRKHSSRHRSRSPYRKHSSRHDRSRSPYRDQSFRQRNGRSRSPNRPSREYRDRRSEPKPEKSQDEDREARLAAMQSDALNLEEDRARRLTEMDKKEAEERLREERKRNKGTNFTAGVYQQTENVGLASRLNGPRNPAVV